MGALSHIRVLDLSRVLAGPWAAQMLGDLGADIIKVERPQTGDDTRSWGPPDITPHASTQDEARSAYFCCANRNKRSLAINMQSPEGAKLVRQLAAECDVVIENFKTGGLRKYQLDYESLKAIHPGLIYCSVTGFGQDGPLAGRAGYDFMIQGMAGLMSITGEPDGTPMKVGVALSDVLTGVYACSAILAALIHRDRTGIGQHIDMSLFDVTAACLANQGFNYLATEKSPPRLGNAHPNIVPYQAFATADGYVILAIGNNQQFERFCELADRRQWVDDPRFSENRARVENREILAPLVAEAMRQKPSHWWLEQLAERQIPAGPIHGIAETFQEPQAEHRKLRPTVTDIDTGAQMPTIASPLRLSATPPQYRRIPPKLGQHSRELLEQILGLTPDDITRLQSGNIIQCSP